MCGRYVIYTADELIDLHHIVAEAQRRADELQNKADKDGRAAGVAGAPAPGGVSAQLSLAFIPADHESPISAASAPSAPAAGTPASLRVKTGEVFPTNIAPVLVAGKKGPLATFGVAESLEAHPMIWGYPQFGGKKGVVFNTRLETAPERPFWRDSLAARRCVVPMSGFYEWQHGGPHDRQRYLFDMPTAPVMFVAGIYKPFSSSEAALAERFSILTTGPNDSLRDVHDRMPVILREDELEEWLYGEPLAFVDRGRIALRRHAVV